MTNPDNGEPVDMPMPEVLEGLGHVHAEVNDLDEHSDPAKLILMVQRLVAEIESGTEYAQRLWHHLWAVVTYLREDIAQAGPAGVLAGSDARGRWAELYGTTLSLLAGPRGDSGYGEQQAHLELQNLTSATQNSGAIG